MGKAAEGHSRRNPSARYRRLLELYREMHARGELTRGIAPERTLPGSSLLPQAHHMRRLVAQTGARSILDYGSGKGSQYRPLKLAEQGVARWASVQEYWGVERIVCFDPAYEPFSRPPQGRFDGVICTDVLEHCPERALHRQAAAVLGRTFYLRSERLPRHAMGSPRLHRAQRRRRCPPGERRGRGALTRCHRLI